MKKSIIALAVAGALTAPMVAQADATLYGSLRLHLNNLDGQELNFGDNTSRIGIKGSSELFNGTKAIFQFEEAVNAADGGWTGPRVATVGVTGDFGTVNLGRQWTPHTLWTVLPFHTQDNSTDGEIAGYANGLGVSLTRLANVGAYVSPNMSGLQFAIAVQADDNGNGEDADATNVAVKYAAGDLYVAASYTDVANVGDHSAVGITYKADAVKVGARFGQTDHDTNGKTDQYSVFANYTMENTTLVVAYSDDENQVATLANPGGDDKVWTVEARQQLGKQARAYVAWIGDEEADGLEVGYRVDF